MRNGSATPRCQKTWVFRSQSANATLISHSSPAKPHAPLNEAPARVVRAAVAAARADDRERARLEREAKAAYVEARVAEAAAMNEELEAVYTDIGGLLAATLDVDGYVELASLKQPEQHPPLGRPDLETPLAPPRRSRSHPSRCSARSNHRRACSGRSERPPRRKPPPGRNSRRPKLRPIAWCIGSW